jgi:hypothetical protein
MTNQTDGSVLITNTHSDGQGWEIRLRNAFGTRSKEFVDANIGSFAAVLKDKDGKVKVIEVDAVIAVLDGAAPDNEIEAMLVMQMAITHLLALRSARRLARSKEIPQQDSNGLALHRLTKAFTSQIEALAKLKRGGAQKVTVEHVHVYPGGQAIVGNVTTAGGGAGFGNLEQPHAPNNPRALALASGATMLCQDPQREALPVSHCSRQEALPDAWRSAGVGGANGKPERNVPARLLHRRGEGRTGDGEKMDA